MEPGAVADVAGALYSMGCYEVSMCDTIGTGTPATVTAMFQVGPGVSLQNVIFLHGKLDQCMKWDMPCRRQSGEPSAHVHV